MKKTLVGLGLLACFQLNASTEEQELNELVEKSANEVINKVVTDLKECIAKKELIATSVHADCATELKLLLMLAKNPNLHVYMKKSYALSSILVASPEGEKFYEVSPAFKDTLTRRFKDDAKEIA